MRYRAIKLGAGLALLVVVTSVIAHAFPALVGAESTATSFSQAAWSQQSGPAPWCLSQNVRLKKDRRRRRDNVRRLTDRPHDDT